MNALKQLAIKYGTDKVNHHNYVHFYNRYFEKWRDHPIRLLEIGVQTGASILMWLEFFPKATIYGVDINGCQLPANPRYHFTRGDQSDKAFWPAFKKNHGGCFHVIVDDGSHKSDGIIPSFEALWPQVLSGGYYCIEDLYCAYRPAYQVKGWQNSMDFIKGLLDDINKGTRGIVSLEYSHELAILLKG